MLLKHFKIRKAQHSNKAKTPTTSKFSCFVDRDGAMHDEYSLSVIEIIKVKIQNPTK